MLSLISCKFSIKIYFLSKSRMSTQNQICSYAKSIHFLIGENFHDDVSQMLYGNNVIKTK